MIKAPKTSENRKEALKKKRYFCFLIGNQIFALPIKKVKEVIAPLPITFIPHTPVFMPGIINLRGTIIAVLNIEKMLDLKTHSTNNNHRIVIVEDNNSTLGVRVCGVRTIKKISADSIKKPPLSLKKTLSSYLMGVVAGDETPIYIIDWSKVINQKDIKKARRGDELC